MIPSGKELRFIQKVFGYGITGHSREHKLAVIAGPGAHEILSLKRILGGYYATTDRDIVCGFERAPRHGLKNVRIACARTSLSTRPLTDNEVRGATSFGEDTHLPILLSDLPLRFDMNDPEMRQRVIVIPFLRGGFLGTEAAQSSLFSWFVEGASMWYKEGLGPTPEAFSIGPIDTK